MITTTYQLPIMNGDPPAAMPQAQAATGAILANYLSGRIPVGYQADNVGGDYREVAVHDHPGDIPDPLHASYTQSEAVMLLGEYIPDNTATSTWYNLATGAPASFTPGAPYVFFFTHVEQGSTGTRRYALAFVRPDFFTVGP